MDQDVMKTLAEFNDNVKSLMTSQQKHQAEMTDHQKATEATLATIKAESERNLKALTSRLDDTDGKIKSFDDWGAEVEQKLEKSRFGGGYQTQESDRLLAAIPERDRYEIRMLETRYMNAGDDLSRFPSGSEGWVRMASKDPVKATAVGLWFRYLIKRGMAHERGDLETVKATDAVLRDLGDALGGYMVEQPDGSVIHRAAGDPLAISPSEAGGYTVPVVTEAVIGWLIKDASSVRAAGAPVLTMTTQSHVLPNSKDFIVYWVGEGAEPNADESPSSPDAPFAGPTLKAERQIGLVALTIEVTQDSVGGLMEFLMANLLNQAGVLEDQSFLDNVGAPAGITGMLGATGVINAGGALTAAGQEAKGAGGEEIVPDLVYAPEHRAAINPGVIWSHPWLARDLIKRSVGTTDASPVYTAAALVLGGIRQPNLFGVPAYFSGSLSKNRNDADNADNGTTPPAATADNSMAYFGNPAYAVVGDRLGTTLEVNRWYEKGYREGKVMLRMMRRVGFVVWVPEYFSYYKWSLGI